jgi:3-phenylpropionate/trans-cinnamate dioxygenase ferredoxin subunit
MGAKQPNSAASAVHGDRTLIEVCSLGELPPGEVHRVPSVPPVAVFNVDGDLYAVDDLCTHQDTSLSDGLVEGCEVECPLHASRFDLRTGRPSEPPATQPLRTHEVRAVDGTVYLALNEGES